MPRVLISILVITLLSVLAACGDIDIANEGVSEFNKLDIENPEGAREMISRLNIPYTVNEFVERARQSDAVAVELFLTTGMNPGAKDENGVTALTAAKEAGHNRIVGLLKEAETGE